MGALKMTKIGIITFLALIPLELFAQKHSTHGTLTVSATVIESHTVNTTIDQKNKTLSFEHSSNSDQPLVIQVETTDQEKPQTHILRKSTTVDLRKYNEKEKGPSVTNITIMSSV